LIWRVHLVMGKTVKKEKGKKRGEVPYWKKENKTAEKKKRIGLCCRGGVGRKQDWESQEGSR